MSWASLLKAGGKAVTWAGKNAGKALLHPQQTLKGAGTALKTAAVGGGLGYVGWKKLTTDESVVGIVSDAIIGEKATQKVSDTVSGAVDGIRDLKDSVSGMSERVSSAAGNVDSKLNGISSFLSDVSSGNGGQMLGGFLQSDGTCPLILPRFRPVRLDGQDRRSRARDDDHRQQLQA